ncbi:MAG: hypothetical protein D6731_01680 [Planctomycetota bacterium]|nr:MAG: hypothetical protein D6731_01680 [Planctomycetota bacterium]
MRNGRGPTRRPTSGRSDPYESRAKGGRGERESEGRRVRSRPGEPREEGRGPASLVLDPGGRCAGMAPCERGRGPRVPRSSKYPASKTGCSWPPRPTRSAGSTLCTTGSTGGRSCGKRGLGNCLDTIGKEHCLHLGVLVGGAEDFVVLCRRRSQANEALRRLKGIFERLRLTLLPEKTRLVETGLGKEGLEFLGSRFRIVKSRFQGQAKDLRSVVEDPNPVLRGWGNGFRAGNAWDERNQIDTSVGKRWIRPTIRSGGPRRKKVKGRRFDPKERPHARFGNEHGLRRLLGTIRLPGRTNAA